ncbi:MAG TPA: hypothetical protein VGC67_16370 [Cellulomonas sp.]
MSSSHSPPQPPSLPPSLPPSQPPWLPSGSSSSPRPRDVDPPGTATLGAVGPGAVAGLGLVALSPGTPDAVTPGPVIPSSATPDLATPDLVTPDLVTPDLVGSAAFQAMLLDGSLRRVWRDVALPHGTSEASVHRAAAVCPLVPARCVVGLLGAVWVHTGGDPPERLDVVVPPRGRRPDPHPHRRVHALRLEPRDITLVAGIRVTTAERTALDLACCCPEPVAATGLRALVSAGLDVGAVLEGLGSLGGRSGARRARATLYRQLVAAPEQPPRPDGHPGPDGTGPDDTHADDTGPDGTRARMTLRPG